MVSNNSNGDTSMDQSGDLWTPFDGKIRGSIDLVLALGCMIPYIFVLIIMIKEKQTFLQHFSFQIIIHVGIMDLLYMLTYVFLGIMLVNNSSICYAINKGSLALSNASWLGMAEMSFILAVNRFITILGVYLPPWFNEKMLYHTLLVLAYGFFLLNFIVMCLPNMGAEFFQPDGQFTLEAGNDFISVKNILYLQEEVMLVLICMMFVLYAIVIIGMVIQRRFLTSHKQPLSSQEILLQAMFIFVYKAVITGMWRYYIPPRKVPYIIFESISLLEAGYNPFMYFIMIGQVRHCVREFFGYKSSKVKVKSFPVNKNMAKVQVVKPTRTTWK